MVQSAITRCAIAWSAQRLFGRDLEMAGTCGRLPLDAFAML